MKRMLMLASVASMIDQFNMPNIELLQEMGYEVHVACNFEKGSTCTDEKIRELKNRLKKMQVPFFQIDFSRNVLKLHEDLKAYQQVLKLVRKNNYEFIHCHSPIGGVVGRLIGHKTNTKVIYTAHGFHFFKGSPLHNWFMYYPIEKYLSRYTDVLITINKEDYKRAKKKFHAKRVEHINGVGVEVAKFFDCKIDVEEKRKELGVPDNALILLTVGELNKRKNQQIIIKALSKVKRKDVYLLICGKGEEEINLRRLAKELGVEERVKFLLFRKDINEICKCSDIYIFPSIREGLGIAALEGMASGLPLIASYVNGIRDYTENGKTGFCLKPMDVDGFAKAIEKLCDSEELRKKMSKYNIEKVKKYDIHNINKVMKKIYEEISREYE